MPIWGRRSAPDADARWVRARGIVVSGLRANPVVVLFDPDLIAALDDPGADLELEAFGFDSLARLEFAVHLSAEHGIEVTAEEIERHRTLSDLTGLVASLL